MIELKNITKKFNQLAAVKDISLKIKKGEIVGFLGPNGAGKTTTLRMIAGVFPATSGQVLINRKNIRRQAYQLKKLIGYLPENNPLYQELTVEEFLKFWLEIKQVAKKKWLERLTFVVKSTGISDVFYRPIAQLSKGYRQRVGLSQAILTEPEILILDEPTEGLDPNQRQEIQKLIKKLGKERTVIIASHVLSEITKIANRMIIIHKGQVVADGTAKKLADYKKSGLTLEVKVKDQKVAAKIKKLKGVLKVEKKVELEEVFSRLTKN